ncbi:MAG: hypothetical protein ABIQ40_15775 [Bacteroidia bacterium]
MKIKNLFIGLCLLSQCLLVAQEDQNAKATKVGEGKFMSYVINHTDGNYTYAGINEDIWTLSFAPFHQTFKEIGVQEFEGSSTTVHYYPDEEAFPCTYVLGANKTRKEMAGYEYINYSPDKRMVILDEWVYFLENWKSKDSYVITHCLKKGELKGMKLMKSAMGAAAQMEKANHKETLQKYLDEAFKKQAELLLLSEWQAKSKATVEKNKLGETRYQFVVDSINGGYWNSPEGKRKQAEMAQAKVTLVNNTATDLLLCYGQGAYTRLKPGEKQEFPCTSGKVYRGTPRVNNTMQFDQTTNVLLDLNGTGCGNSVNASSVVK